MREVIRPCKDCGERVRFKFRYHIPVGLALLCPRCWKKRGRHIAADRSPKQSLRKPTDRHRP